MHKIWNVSHFLSSKGIGLDEENPFPDGDHEDEVHMIPIKTSSHGVFVNNTKTNGVAMKIGTAIFYATASFFATVINKSVLTAYKFPSFQFLAFGQMITTVVILYLAKRLGYIAFPNFNLKIFRQIFPLPFFYVGNMIFGLGGTKELSLPMFTMLRRFAILMTMVGEYLLLDIIPSLGVQLSLFLMILGALIAAAEDFGFNLRGYINVLLNDLTTAGNFIIIKQKLNMDSEMDRNGLMYYSSLFMLPMSFTLLWLTGDFGKAVNYTRWREVSFLIQFGISCVMGCVLIYSIMICTQVNSALTTTIVGSLKDLFIIYLGMFIANDYVYSLENFVGINVSVIGSLWYTWIIFNPSKRRKLMEDSPKTV